MSPDLLLPTLDTTEAPAADFAAQCNALLLQQKLTWGLLRVNYANLDDLQTRSIDFDGFQIRLQYNPHRLTSSAAKVDDRSVRQRKCFLCPDHLPGPQRALPFGDDYLMLCNPFPIFPEHFTIPTREHVPQRLSGAVATMLLLSQAISSRYTVFYNGPRCGASAPDHLHFQAASRGVMPLESEYERLFGGGSTLIESARLRVCAIEKGLRPFIALESDDAQTLVEAMDSVIEVLEKLIDGKDEPMINLLCTHNSGRWRLLVFPRGKHRPSFFFAHGDAKILLSPASVDLGGLCIIPVEKDFHRLTREHIIQMFSEVCLNGPIFHKFCENLALALRSR